MEEGKKELTLEDELYRIGFVFLIAGSLSLYVAVKWILPNISGMECVFQKFWGLYCPGCGGTRSVIAFLHGHFLESLWYHPIVPYTVAVFGWFMLSHTLARLRFPFVRGMKFHTWQLYLALAVIVGNCLLKNVLWLGFGIAM